jgi:hypothetical protein
MTVAVFKVRGRLDSAGGDKDGTIKVDRETGKVTVRVRGSRTVYETTIGRVATLVCQNTMGVKPVRDE